MTTPIAKCDNENPWLAMDGIHDPYDPEVIAWKQAMAVYRDIVEKESSAELSTRISHFDS